MSTRAARRAGVAALAIGLAMASASPGRTEPPPPNPADPTGAVLALARDACGSCHQRSLPTAKPKALAVFDLDAPGEWSARMSGRQLRAFPGRFGGALDETTRPRVRAFVDTALARLPPSRR
jgi:hypothetical protein